MNRREQTTIALAVVGLGAAWYWQRKNAAALAALAARLPANPAVLPSRPIGSGFLDAVWGGTGLSGLLPSAPIGRGYVDPITGGTGLPGVHVDPETGDVTAPHGTDIMLSAIDPYDPTLAQMPNVEPVNGDLIAAAMNYDPTSADDPELIQSPPFVPQLDPTGQWIIDNYGLDQGY